MNSPAASYVVTAETRGDGTSVATVKRSEIAFRCDDARRFDGNFDFVAVIDFPDLTAAVDTWPTNGIRLFAAVQEV